MGGDLADQDKPHIETHILLLSLVNFPTSGFEFPSFKLDFVAKKKFWWLCVYPIEERVESRNGRGSTQFSWILSFPTCEKFLIRGAATIYMPPFDRSYL